MTYEASTPLVYTLSVAALSSGAATVTAEGYKPGSNGLQIGFGADSDVRNMRLVIESGLIISNYTVTSTGTSISLTVSATPDYSITFAIFGLEKM